MCFSLCVLKDAFLKLYIFAVFEIVKYALICELHIIWRLVLTQEMIVGQHFGLFARMLAFQLGQNANVYEAYTGFFFFNCFRPKSSKQQSADKF